MKMGYDGHHAGHAPIPAPVPTGPIFVNHPQQVPQQNGSMAMSYGDYQAPAPPSLASGVQFPNYPINGYINPTLLRIATHQDEDDADVEVEVDSDFVVTPNLVSAQASMVVEMDPGSEVISNPAPAQASTAAAVTTRFREFFKIVQHGSSFDVIVYPNKSTGKDGVRDLGGSGSVRTLQLPREIWDYPTLMALNVNGIIEQTLTGTQNFDRANRLRFQGSCVR